MEGGPFFRTGPESDPSFFPAVAQDTFIILVHLFYIIFFSSEFTADYFSVVI